MPNKIQDNELIDNKQNFPRSRREQYLSLQSSLRVNSFKFSYKALAAISVFLIAQSSLTVNNSPEAAALRMRETSSIAEKSDGGAPIAAAAAVWSRSRWLSARERPSGTVAARAAERPMEVEVKGESWSQTERHSRSSRVWEWRVCERPGGRWARVAEEGLGVAEARNGGGLATEMEKRGLASFMAASGLSE